MGARRLKNYVVPTSLYVPADLAKPFIISIRFLIIFKTSVMCMQNFDNLISYSQETLKFFQWMIKELFVIKMTEVSGVNYKIDYKVK